MDSYSYWSKREKAHAELQKASDEEITKQLIANLEASRDEINDRINLFYERYAGSQGITLEESMKRISESDTKAFSKRAKELVKNKDTSDEANRELKLYNATMRINRLEMLKAEIDLELLIATEKNGKLIEKQLKNTAYKEYQRQAGILGEMIPVSQKQVLALINSSVNTAGQVTKPVWNQTLWTNQQEMANELNIIIRRAITQGVNATTAVSRIADKFDSYKSRAKTLLVTETAFVQGLVQLDSFISAGFDEYVYLSESRACKICKALDGKVFKIDDLEVGKNFYPMHPNCKCSAAPHMSDEEFKQFEKTGKPKTIKNNQTLSEEFFNSNAYDKAKKSKEQLKDLETEISELYDKYRTYDPYSEIRVLMDKERAALEHLIDSGKISEEEYYKSLSVMNKRHRQMKQDALDRNPYLVAYEKAVSKYEKTYENSLYENANSFKEFLSTKREVGNKNYKPSDLISNTRSRSAKALMESFDFLPTDWIDISQENGKLKLANRDRGYYQGGEICLGSKYQVRTGIHELMHRLEHLDKTILEKEKAFYEKRTAGEKLQKLRDVTGNKGYNVREVTKVDNFLEPYMGRDYDGRAYELLSMGVEWMYTNPTELAKDKEMFDWVMDILVNH